MQSEADTEPLEVVVDRESRRVALKTLQAAFQNATGLRYRNPKTKAFRLCRCDWKACSTSLKKRTHFSLSPCGQWILAPATGWADISQYVVIRAEPVVAAGASVQSASPAKSKSPSTSSILDRKRQPDVGNNNNKGANLKRFKPTAADEDYEDCIQLEGDDDDEDVDDDDDLEGWFHHSNTHLN